MRADAYGNVVSQFAREGAVGDFAFDAFVPPSRAGAAAATAANCTVACARLYAWKGAKVRLDRLQRLEPIAGGET
eukprot:8941606-Pyramimonas_sp.AAC.1